MLASKLLHFVSLTDSFIMFDAKLLNSILNVNNNSFTDPLIIGAFEKRVPGFESQSGHLLDLFSVVPSSNPLPRLYLANWLPPASWGFNPFMLYLDYLFLRI